MSLKRTGLPYSRILGINTITGTRKALKNNRKLSKSELN
jgi:hypothetical protein